MQIYYFKAQIVMLNRLIKEMSLDICFSELKNVIFYCLLVVNVHNPPHTLIKVIILPSKINTSL